MWSQFPKDSNGADGTAAPILVSGIILRNHWQGIPVEEKLQGKLDTAASMTAIPIDVALRMKLPSKGTLKDMRSFDHSIKLPTYPKFQVELYTPQLGWTIIPVVACPRNDVLIGRDLCSKILLLVNWQRNGFGMQPAKKWHRPLELLFARLRKNRP